MLSVRAHRNGTHMHDMWYETRASTDSSGARLQLVPFLGSRSSKQMLVLCTDQCNQPVPCNLVHTASWTQGATQEQSWANARRSRLQFTNSMERIWRLHDKSYAAIRESRRQFRTVMKRGTNHSCIQTPKTPKRVNFYQNGMWHTIWLQGARFNSMLNAV